MILLFEFWSTAVQIFSGSEISKLFATSSKL